MDQPHLSCSSSTSTYWWPMSWLVVSIAVLVYVLIELHKIHIYTKMLQFIQLFDELVEWWWSILWSSLNNLKPTSLLGYMSSSPSYSWIEHWTCSDIFESNILSTILPLISSSSKITKQYSANEFKLLMNESTSSPGF